MVAPLAQHFIFVRQRVKPALWPLLVVLISCIFSITYLQLFNQWWYQDDPVQYEYVLPIEHPGDIFTNSQVVREFGARNALIPMQILSYWLDTTLFGINPLAAYGHNLVSFALVSLLFYIVLRHWTGQPAVALAATVLWMLLPSTIAVHSFISTRHYMEGLGFALLAVVMIQHGLRHNSLQQPGTLLALVCVSVCAMLCKEIYATTIPTLLALVALGYRRPYLFLSACMLVVSYAAYRLSVLGFNMSYTMPFVDTAEYMRFLGLLPFLLTADYTGYLLYAGLGLLTIAFLWSYRSFWQNPAILTASLLTATLLALYPVTYVLLIDYMNPGTWYRAPFLLNTILVLWGAYAISTLLKRPYRAAVLLACAGLLLLSTERTRMYWQTSMARARAEGMFYLNHPDKLLYSEDDASWFMPGVHALYDVPTIHFIYMYEHTTERSYEAIQRYDTIWRYHEGDFIADPELFETIRQENGLP